MPRRHNDGDGSGPTRRGFLRLAGLSAGALGFGGLPFLGGCTTESIWVDGEPFDSGDLLATGTALPGETPAELFDRVTDGLTVERRFRGLTTWRQIEGSLASLTTPDVDDSSLGADRFVFEGRESIAFFVAEFVAVHTPDGGESFDDLREVGPAGSEMVVIRDQAHYAVQPFGDRSAEDDFILYVRANAANGGPVEMGGVA